jgi:osmoprotectant transport system ATP-binding protein
MVPTRNRSFLAPDSRGASATPVAISGSPAAHASAEIEIRDLEKRYHGTLALTLERFDVAPRTSLAVLGPSGCGKSTLLRLVVGLIAPDRGAITIGGVPLSPATRRAIRLRTGYVIQEGGLFPHLSARENVALMPRHLGWDAARIQNRIRELLELTRLPDALLDRFPVQLSGGQRQRVALMRALVLDPDVLLMDEPLSALDPMIRADLQRELGEWFARLRKTVVIVTHDVAEAAALGDEIAIMKEGRVVQRGRFDELESRPADPFVTAFLSAQQPARPRRASPS